MKTTAKSVTKKMSLDDLPRGSFYGLWNGYKVTVPVSSQLEVILDVKDGVRGSVLCYVVVSTDCLGKTIVDISTRTD